MCEQLFGGSLIVIVVLEDTFVSGRAFRYFCIEGFNMTWFHNFEWERQKNECNKDKGKGRGEVDHESIIQSGRNPNRCQNRWSRFNRNTKA